MILDNLNPVQREAVTHLGSSLMIIAGAGTGKTRVITHRIAFLHRECGIPLNQILAVTFTNKAAREMRERVCRILGVLDTPGLPIGTFHSRCAMILRREAAAAQLNQNFAILDENDQKQAIKRVLKELDISEKRVRPGQVQTFINQAKMRLLTPQDCKEEFDEDEIPYPDIYAKYQETIEKCSSVDFEDLLMKVVTLFQQNEDIRQKWVRRYQYVLIDEYQDTNHAQFLLTKLLGGDHGQICVVGDEDQSIYSWRGAEISNLLDFEKTFPGTRIVKLEQNYRSTMNILRAASTVIAHNTQRIGKTLFTELGEGEPLAFVASFNQDDEAKYIARECLRLIESEGVSPDEIAVFYRGHWLSRAVEDMLRRYRVPYRVVGGMRFYDRAEIKDLLSYLRLAINPNDDLAFERVVNRPTRGIGAKALGQITERAASKGTSFYHAAQSLAEAGGMKGKARAGLADFLNLVDHCCAMSETAEPADVLRHILDATDFRKTGIGDADTIEGESRLENIDELLGLMEEFETSAEGSKLAEFLSSMALDATEEDTGNQQRVSLLTIHNAKGLEFDHVFTIGLERGVFPTSRAEESMDEYAVEEERRLFYVAITRARYKFTAMYSHQRNRPDFWSGMQPSIFLTELPPSVFDEAGRTSLRRLLPAGWDAQDNEATEEPREGRYYVMDDEASTSSARPNSGLYARMTRGFSGGGGGLTRPVHPSSGKPKFSVGMRVVHKFMGTGVISEIGGRPGWERARVDFDDGRSQEFVLRYAPLAPGE